MSTVEVAVSAPHPPGSGAGPDARRIAARLLCQQSFRQHLAGIILASQPWLTMPALEREAVDEPNRFDRHRAEPEHRIRHGNAAVDAGRGAVHARACTPVPTLRRMTRRFSPCSRCPSPGPGGAALSFGAEGCPAGRCLLRAEAQKESRAPLLLKTLDCSTVRMPGPTQDATCAPDVAPDPMTDQVAWTR